VTPFEESVLFAALEKEVSAWDILHDPKASGELNAEQVLELCIQAGYGEEAAQKAAVRRANQRLDRDLTP
jgi:hypothetical protein